MNAATCLVFDPAASIGYEAIVRGSSLVVTFEGEELSGEVKIWDGKGDRIGSFQLQSKKVTHLALSADQRLLLFLEGDFLGAIDLDERGRAATTMRNQKYQMHVGGPVSALAVSPEKAVIAVAVGNQVQLYHVRDGKVPKKFQTLDLPDTVISITFASEESVQVQTKNELRFFACDN